MSGDWKRALRRRWLCRRVDRPLAEALLDYESVFGELHAEVGGRTVGRVRFSWLVDGGPFNAAASWLLWGGRRVRLAFACLQQLQGHCNALLCSPEFLPGLGQTEAPLEQADTDAPACPIRREASFVTIELALCLIALHEVAHLELRHGGLRRPRLFAARHETLAAAAPVSTSSALRSQAEELEADRFAFRYLIARAAAGQAPFPEQLIGEQGVREQLLELALAAHALVVCLLGGMEHDVERFATSSHPHPAVRLVGCHTWLATVLPAKVRERVKPAATFASLAEALFGGERVRAVLVDQAEAIANQVAALDALLDPASDH